MNILTIDTSTRMEVIAVGRNGAVSDMTTVTGVSHSVTLFENIDAALKNAGLAAKDLQLIGVGIGPGSFTGIRIGVSTARMMAQLLKIPLVGFHSPMLFACSVGDSEGNDIIIAFDAKKGRVFGGLYRNTGGPVPGEIVPPGDYTMEFLIAHIDRRRPLVLAGDGAEKFHEVVSGSLPSHTLLRDFKPSGAAGCRLTEHLHRAAPDRYADIQAVVPYYARKSDAEILREIHGRKSSG